jgi:hypothetical protein
MRSATVCGEVDVHRLVDSSDPAFGGVAGAPVVRPAPDAERDARRAAYRERERLRAVAALDRYIKYVYGNGE